jgi:bifunctional NMN adenylyltransferase/nudix hydrolase
MDYQYDYLVFIGRFQPFHSGHFKIAQRALTLAKNLIFVLGSHDSPRTVRDPFTSTERGLIIMSCFSAEEDKKRLHFFPQENFMYNDNKWLTSINDGVHKIIWGQAWTPDPIKIGLIGLQKDHSSYYLTKFPHWGHVDVNSSETVVLDATAIRNAYLSEIPYYNPASHGGIDWAVNDAHGKLVLNLFNMPEMNVVKAEYLFLQKYKQQWKNSPYPPIFSTVDNVVIQSGHILLVTRGAMPGEGQIALPGGFINQNESILTAAIRELREETGLKVPSEVLRGSIVKQQVFDNPFRSQRGRTITHAFYYKLAERNELPKIKGADDAKDAFWWPLNKVQEARSLMFEDHYDIISEITGTI